MYSMVLPGTNERLWRIEKHLGEAREKVRLLEEDERMLTWMHKVEDACRQRIERMASDFEPRGRVSRMLVRLIGVKPPDMVRDVAGILLEPVMEELEEGVAQAPCRRPQGVLQPSRRAADSDIAKGRDHARRAAV